jgi:hypothetical protein
MTSVETTMPLGAPALERGDRADLVVAGQQADQEARDAHQGHRQHEHPLAAQAIAEVAEDQAAERAGEVAGGERAEAGDRGQCRIEVGEEDLAEDHRARRGVEKEVVVLDETAEEAGRDGSAELSAHEVHPRLRGRGTAEGWFVRVWTTG